MSVAEQNYPEDTHLRPGEKAHKSGIYQEMGPRGGKGREVTVVKGEPLPPTEMPDHTYTLVRPAHNTSGDA